MMPTSPPVSEYYEDCATANVRSIEEDAYAAAVAEYPAPADYWEAYVQLYYEDGDYDSVVRTLKQADAAKIPFNDAMMQYWNEAYYACNVSNSRAIFRCNWLEWMVCTLDGMEKKMSFSAAQTANCWTGIMSLSVWWDRALWYCVRMKKAKAFAFQLSQNLMVGRFMAEIEEGNGYGDGLFPVKPEGPL